MVKKISNNDFKNEVLDYKDRVFVDFYAEWCGPCKITTPLIEELSEENKNIKFVKINVDENSDLASKYSVFSIPTFFIFKNGEIVSQFVGALSKEGFIKEIEKTE
jgi:thioredoxin 1